MKTQQRQWIQIHYGCAVIASHLAKKEAAADVVVVADAVTAGAWEGELVCDAEFACEGECVWWRLGDASAGASLEASATMGEIWGETERGGGVETPQTAQVREGKHKQEENLCFSCDICHTSFMTDTHTHYTTPQYIPVLVLSTFRWETPDMFRSPPLSSYVTFDSFLLLLPTSSVSFRRPFALPL